MINAGSRYSRHETQVVVHGDRSIVEITPARRPRWAFTFAYYRIRPMDRLDRIAHAEYGDATMWWVIADANPEIQDFTRVEPGTLIRIPSA